MMLILNMYPTTTSTTNTIIQCKNDCKADYNNGLIPCSATMVVVCLVVIQTTV